MSGPPKPPLHLDCETWGLIDEQQVAYAHNLSSTAITILRQGAAVGGALVGDSPVARNLLDHNFLEGRLQRNGQCHVITTTSGLRAAASRLFSTRGLRDEEVEAPTEADAPS